MVNVTIYSSTMDPMGMEKHHFLIGTSSITGPFCRVRLPEGGHVPMWYVPMKLQ